MKYGIRLKGKVEHGGFYVVPRPKSTISEHTGQDNEKPLTFDTVADAEVYAQEHEFRNYHVEPV